MRYHLELVLPLQELLHIGMLLQISLLIELADDGVDVMGLEVTGDVLLRQVVGLPRGPEDEQLSAPLRS